MTSSRNQSFYHHPNEYIQCNGVQIPSQVSTLRALLLLTGEVDHVLQRTNDADMVMLRKSLELLSQVKATPSA